MTQEIQHPLDIHLKQWIASVDWTRIQEPTLSLVLGNVRGFVAYLKKQEPVSNVSPVRSFDETWAQMSVENDLQQLRAAAKNHLDAIEKTTADLREWL